MSKLDSKLFSDESTYKEAAPCYDAALERPNFNCITSIEQNVDKPQRHKQRKILWYNPPYSMIVATTIVTKFQKAIDTHF